MSSELFNPMNWEYVHLPGVIVCLLIICKAIMIAGSAIKNTSLVEKQRCKVQLSHNNEHIHLSLLTVLALCPLLIVYTAQLIRIDTNNGIIILLSHLDSIFEIGLLCILLWALKHIADEEDPLSEFYAYNRADAERRKERRLIEKDRRSGKDRRAKVS